MIAALEVKARRVRCFWILLALLLSTALAGAHGPRDNIAENVRPVPPPGITVPAAERQELEAGLKELRQEIEKLRTAQAGKPALDLLPDVQIYEKAVRWALIYNEVYQQREIPVAKTLLKQGLDRARQLHDGKAPWPTAT